MTRDDWLAVMNGARDSFSILGWTALGGLKSIHVLWVPRGTFEEMEFNTRVREYETVDYQALEGYSIIARNLVLQRSSLFVVVLCLSAH